MKKIAIELTQIGIEVITQSSVRIKINQKFIKNELKAILEECIEIKNKTVKTSFYLDAYNSVKIIIKFENGNKKEFIIKKPEGFGDCDLNVLHREINTKNVLGNSLKLLKKAVEEIENYIEENHSTYKNYFFEV